jgi:hypothetical protein
VFWFINASHLKITNDSKCARHNLTSDIVIKMFSKQITSTFRKLLNVQNSILVKNDVRSLFVSSQRLRDVVDRREMLRSVPKLDDGSAGEKAYEVDNLITQ